MVDFHQLYQDARRRAESHGIQVREESLGPEKAGQFDGLSITINPSFNPQDRCFYLVHALGSIVRWSLDPDQCQALFQELRDAKRHRRQDPGRLEQAVAGWCAFEEAASEYGVWLLADLGHAEAIPAYTNFFRADQEAMVQLHRHGSAPDWPEFFARWNQEVAAGARGVRPYQPNPVPSFQPVAFREQEVIQEKDDKS
ncbi:MAG: hypothetical protein JO112_03065 [Planctomycetes bacterium]|nr:hypothetical protein [Planctomycetota bacterium]